ncbi:MAG: hypothetical protein KKC26_00020, partial [Nanoarchaeota archaeon]|nr:hypothetical protein [Nanoarchaeota archaeon]
VSFIKNQLKAGYDAMTIRDYLLNRHYKEKDINVAMDYLFSSEFKEHNSKKLKSIVIISLIIVILIFVSLMYSIVFHLKALNKLEYLSLTEESISLEQEDLSYLVCADFFDDEKFSCYEHLFNNDFSCREVLLEDEQDFCYKANDIYVLSGLNA